MSDVCSSCPHAVVDHLETGCMTCSCLNVFYPADPETTPETGAVVPQNDGDSGITVLEPTQTPEGETPSASASDGDGVPDPALTEASPDTASESGSAGPDSE